MGDRDLFLIVLSDVIKERIQRNEFFYDFEHEIIINSEERYTKIFNELSLLSLEIFQDEEFYQEQFYGFNNYYEYLNVIIDNLVKDDSAILYKVQLANSSNCETEEICQLKLSRAI